jgi:hypothetical protein
MLKKLLAFTCLTLSIGANTAYAATITADGVWGLEFDSAFYDIAIGDQGGLTAGEVFGSSGLTGTPDPTLNGINTALINLLVTESISSDFLMDATGCFLLRFAIS